MKLVGKLYINGKWTHTVVSDKHLQLVSLKAGDLVDVINETGRTCDDAEIKEAGIYHFGLKQDGTVFLIRGW